MGSEFLMAQALTLSQIVKKPIRLSRKEQQDGDKVSVEV